MALHDFKITFRRLAKERLYSLINVGGLAIGMAAALLIILFLLFELSYDRHHKDHDRIYRIATDVTLMGERTILAINSLPVGPLMVDQLPEFTSSLRIFPSNYFFRNLIYRYEDKHFFEGDVFSADSTMFEFFTFKFLEGNPETALNEPFSLVMTESMARRYFDDTPAFGKMIHVDGAGSFKVTAVVEDPSANTHFQFSGLMSLCTMRQLDDLLASAFGPGATWPMLENNHGSRMAWVYLKAVEGFDPQGFLENRWDDFNRTHISVDGFLDENYPIFQAIADIHLKSKLPYEMESETGAVHMMSPELIRVFFAIAIFLLVIAAINYTNIAISRFNRRSKEVGVKKVLGAQRIHLIRQFFLESVFTTIAALLLALLLVEICLPMVNQLLGVSLSLNFFQNPGLLLVLFGVALFVGLIAGGYPAIYFSSFLPIQVLKQRFQAGNKTITLKKALIVIQFTISVFMIIATLVVGRQLQFINNKDLGFDQEQVVVVELQDEHSRTSAGVLRDQLLQSPHILDASVSNYFPSILTMFNSLGVEGEAGLAHLSANIAQVNPDFLDFMGMTMAEGRFFSWDHQSDFYDAVVINESAKRYFGWEDAIGKTITSGYIWPDGTSCENRRVIGVVSDFHFASLTKPIEPMVWYPMRNAGTYLNVRIAGESFSDGLEAIQKAWSGFRPNNPLEYHFLDQVIAGMYESQRVLGVFFAAFAWLCIIIAFLGLYGLSAYSVEQRTREIGIRKVLGAGFADVLMILGREFAWLILIGVVIASVLAHQLMTRWLAGFAYHTQLTAAPFVIAVLASFGIAFLAVVYHARKASKMDPTTSLKYE
jgi:putative ABC transport system permease protein